MCPPSRRCTPFHVRTCMLLTTISGPRPVAYARDVATRDAMRVPGSVISGQPAQRASHAPESEGSVHEEVGWGSREGGGIVKGPIRPSSHHQAGPVCALQAGVSRYTSARRASRARCSGFGATSEKTIHPASDGLPLCSAALERKRGSASGGALSSHSTLPGTRASSRHLDRKGGSIHRGGQLVAPA